MNTFPTISPSVEYRKKLNDKYLLEIDYNSLSSLNKDTLFNFALYNSGDTFYYWTKNKYTLSANTNYLVVQNYNLLIMNDDSVGVDVAASPETTEIKYSYLPTDTSFFFDDVIITPITLLVNQQYYYDDWLYLTITTSLPDLKIVVRQVNSNYLILSVWSDKEVVNKTLIINKNGYAMNGYHYWYIVYGLTITNNKVILAHNNHYVEVDLKRDLSNITIDLNFNKNLNEFVLFKLPSDGEVLSQFKRWLGNTINITEGTQSISLSKTVPVSVYGQLRYITEFYSDSVDIGFTGSEYYTNIKLITV